jgi:hypothetical protein
VSLLLLVPCTLLTPGGRRQRVTSLLTYGSAVLALGAPFVVRASTTVGGFALSTVDSCYVWAFRVAEAQQNMAIVDSLTRQCRDTVGLAGPTAASRLLLDLDLIAAGLPINAGRLGTSLLIQWEWFGIAIIVLGVGVVLVRDRRPVLAVLAGVLIAPLIFFVTVFTIEGRYVAPLAAGLLVLAAGAILASAEALLTRQVASEHAARARAFAAAAGLILIASAATWGVTSESQTLQGRGTRHRGARARRPYRITASRRPGLLREGGQRGLHPARRNTRDTRRLCDGGGGRLDRDRTGRTRNAPAPGRTHHQPGGNRSAARASGNRAARGYPPARQPRSDPGRLGGHAVTGGSN